MEFPHRYRSRGDIEASAFIAASFSFGGVAQIRSFLERLFPLLGPSPHAALSGADPFPEGSLRGSGYRFVSPGGVRRFLHCLRAAYRECGSLEELYRRGADAGGSRERLARFLGWFGAAWGPSLPRERAFLFPDPGKGSACKRHNLFLRWMVRRGDGVDFGLWKEPAPSDLIVPLDAHMFRIGRLLGLTDRRAADWKAAEEITDAFRRVCPEDPTRFDFALTRIGILGECTGRRKGACDACALRRICRQGRHPGRN